MAELYRFYGESMEEYHTYLRVGYVKRTGDNPDKIEISIGRQSKFDDNKELYEFIKIKNPRDLTKLIGILSLALGLFAEKRTENRNEIQDMATSELLQGLSDGIKRANGIKESR